MDKKVKNENQIVSVSFFVERIMKPTGDVIMIVRGGSPQIPQTLFVGSPDDFCDFIYNM